ncbi:MAG: helix-turn-helix transcriptional regulator [Pseudomonadota bacterium]
MIKRQQITAARGLLSWTKTDLAARADVSERTIARFESGEGDITARKLERMEDALVGAGVEFIDGGVVLDSLKRARRAV